MLTLSLYTLLTWKPVTEGLAVASRPRKRKPPSKNKYFAHEEPNSGLGGEAILKDHGKEDYGTIYSIRFGQYWNRHYRGVDCSKQALEKASAT